MLQNYDIPGTVEAGTDEAGRGCIAGPVYAAAVILPADFNDPGLNDSKQLSRRERERLRDIIVKEAMSWCVASASPEEIDDVNILNASILSMHRALDGLGTTPEHIIVDGNRFKAYKNIPFTCFVKGDGRYASIAAASILAKTFRDDFMRDSRYFPIRNYSNPSLLRVNSNLSPEGLADTALMLPPCRLTAFLTIESPSPVPPILRLRPLSTR